jgi:hypothetical protein
VSEPSGRLPGRQRSRQAAGGRRSRPRPMASPRPPLEPLAPWWEGWNACVSTARLLFHALLCMPCSLCCLGHVAGC